MLTSPFRSSLHAQDFASVLQQRFLDMPDKKAISIEEGFETTVFSHAVFYGGLVYVSGNIGMDYPTKALVKGTVADRTRKALDNIRKVLESANSSLQNLVKVNVYLTNMDDWDAMNKAYCEIISEPRPARTCVTVSKLPFGTDIEIECIAHS